MRYYFPVILIIVLAVARFALVCGFSGVGCKETPILPEIAILTRIRNASIEVVDQNFPSPHSELLLGMLIGLDRLAEVPQFSQNLRDTSTIHVVVVSGFNIALVFGLVTRLLGSEYKIKNILIAQIFTLFYSLLSGFEPPVVRALVMGSIVAWGKYSGRLIDGMRILFFAASVMVLISPSYLSSVSFQLSFGASLGLILFSNLLSNIKLPEDLKSTLAAQILVWPIISLYFGKVSMIGIVVNPLILWTVPIATILGGIFLMLGFISPFLAKLFSVIIYPFLDVFARLVTYFGSLKHISLDYKIGIFTMLVYYLVVITCVLYFKKVTKSKNAVKKD
jgi:competence protein ComEC